MSEIKVNEETVKKYATKLGEKA
ncbi:DUF3130 family protein, partial [Listeria seeligeri]|nr:DUF3130 family protein [Listeria seeligeri]